ncbi:MAG: glucose-1-phosphate adenylyltransferase [Holophagales bacterium]|jgi:glucose-1-phosphate adenylyltransferase|nr:glucose-1-phosphate adenylyltransferase [Holophagales bacterium]
MLLTEGRPALNYMSTMAVILAGGRGTRLMDLTSDLAKPGLDFGGKYKVIDFTLSNCVNSGFRRIAVLTQYNSHRLLQHLQSGWTFLPGKMDEFVHVYPAQQNEIRDSWYMGTADAVYQNLENIQAMQPEIVLVLAGDHIYRMDYRLFLQDHLETEADLTIACLQVHKNLANQFGVARVDDNDRIIAFVEKPSNPPTIPGRPDTCLVSMGIYIFNSDFLYNQLAIDAGDPDSTHDFGKDIIPKAITNYRVFAHRFEKSTIQTPSRPEPYWRDVGTLDSYWETNLDLTYVEPALNLYDIEWPIFTHQEQLPPAKLVHSEPGRQGMAIASLISAGCIISGAHILQSLISNNVRIHSHAFLEESVVLPQADIGRKAFLRKCVVARGCRIPEGFVAGRDPVDDARRFYRTANGVTLISQRMLNQLSGF